ncbi:hypothetical protein [Pseudonocardia spinosispora]|uniref:hypothetical protein n=1 Tax=Pseudonocardia spinosispora TaxID=103441 RepID=UPI000409896F|nr:hypothetical protein [Pseudonocardia spinosispora]
MYELSRVRLFSVGPPGARYQDVCLDFRGIGPSVKVAPQQDLFADDDLDRVPRRPSPASVLFLENGGGKSVLLKLVFSVLLPGRRQVVGTTNTRVLEKFVLADDVAHVVLEWMHTVTGERVVTGKVSEWRGHVVSSDPAKLIDCWYSFRPTDGFSLDDLPVAVNNRRVTLAGFRERLDQAHQSDPGLALIWRTVHREWSQHLVELGLDPELFRYQRAMNAGEGEAAEAFSFPSDEAFVDFLLRAVVDQEEPQGLAEVVAGYAAKIAQRAELELEREFVEGTLERLGPLVDAEHRAQASRSAETSARNRARLLAASIAARHRAEVGRVEIAGAALRDATEAAQRAGSEQRRLNEVSTELRRQVADLTCRAAEATRDTLQERKDEASELVEAWHAVEAVLRDQLASAEAARLRRVVTTEQERARPALDARQAAATALASALRAVVDEALEAARSAAEQARSAAELAETARAQELRWTTEAAEHRSAVDQAHAELGRIRDLVTAAVSDGALRAEDDVEETAEVAAREEREAAASVEETLKELAALRGERREADARLTEARAEAADAVAEARTARDRDEDARAQHANLASEPRLGELLGVESITVDQDAEALLERLAASLAALDDERTRLRDAQLRDVRALRALGSGGLLPEPTEVEQSLAVLERAGISARSGWRHLASLTEDQRSATIARVPHLVAGVLLSDAADGVRARDALAEARLLPCALVAVGSLESIRPDGADPAVGSGIDFVVPPNPAMFDDAAAERVRTELTEETRRRRDRLATLDGAWDTDRTLTERLRRWREAYPPAALTELAEAGIRAAEAARARTSVVERALAAVADLDTRADQLDAALPRLRASEAAARARSTRLASLRTEVLRRPELSEAVIQGTAAAAAADAQAAEARKAAAQAHRDSQEYVRAQDRGASVAATARDDLAELPTDAVESSTTRDAPAQPLSVLRTEYRRAEAAYAAAEVDADLRAGLAAAEREAESARAAVDPLPDRVRRAAHELLRSPDGSDASSRRAAADQATRTLREVEARLQSAHTELALARRTRDEYRPQRISLAPYGEPTDIEHGAGLVERVEQDRRAAEAAASTEENRRVAAASQQRAVQVSADGFGRLVDGLDDLVPDTGHEDTEAFSGDVNAASASWIAARGGLQNAISARDGVDNEVRKSADAVAHHAQEARFGTVSSPVRRHILGVSRAEMPPLAADWLRALRPRLRSLEDDLANIGRHRTGIVTRLQGMVGESLRTLRLAQRLSQLPDGLSDWSGQQFLRFRFEEIDDDTVLAERLGEVVDRTAEGYLSGGKEQRDGMSLLLRGVRAAMPRGVRVEMLKPDAVLRTERLRVSEIRDVFSGGQQLTAAIVLYCTMAALRANQRGEGRRPHAGVLFLDNPIGRASAGYLLELQFGVAHALGVQLVYTTGLFDAGALSTFPLLVRLRNDADLRAGRKYLSVDEQIARRLDELPPEDGTGRLASVRLFRRPEPVST